MTQEEYRQFCTDVLDSGNTAPIRPTDDATRGEIAHAIHAFREDVAK